LGSGKTRKRQVFAYGQRKVLENSFWVNKTELLLQGKLATRNLVCASHQVKGYESGGEGERLLLVKVKSSQKIFTEAEVASLTGICVEHLHNFARSRHLGFIARAAEAAGARADQWLFTLSDLMVLVTLFPRCTH
jgi:hypothetical protein